MLTIIFYLKLQTIIIFKAIFLILQISILNYKYLIVKKHRTIYLWNNYHYF